MKQLQATRLQLEEVKAIAIKDREAARKAIEEANPLIEGTPAIVENTELINTLTVALEKMTAALHAQTVSKVEVKQAYDAVLINNKEMMKKLEDEKNKSDQRQEVVQRLEEKVSDLESEIQVLRQQALAISLTRQTSSAQPKTITNPVLDEVPYKWEPETEGRPQKSLNEKHQEKQDLLIKFISQDQGFSKGKPVAAFIIYKCLMQWRSFEVEKTSIFDLIIQTIAGSIASQDSSDRLSYWLSNSAMLLLLIQRTLKAPGTKKLTQRRRACPFLVLGCLPQGLRRPTQSASYSINRSTSGLIELVQVEAKYPGSFFKQQLTGYLEKIYGMIVVNLKKEIKLVLEQCIQTPKTSRASLVRGRSRANAVTQQALIAHWQNIVQTLNNYLNTMRANHVPYLLLHKVFTQVFFLINAVLFNSILVRRECCSFSNGEYLKAGLSELEQWCYDAKEECAGSAWNELSHIRQAVGLLVVHQKQKKSLIEITTVLCPSLSIQQLYRISTMYWDDKYGTHSVSPELCVMIDDR